MNTDNYPFYPCASVFICGRSESAGICGLAGLSVARAAAAAAGPARSAVARAGRVGALAVIGAAAMLHAVPVRQLVAKAALQPPALPRQLRRVQAELLLLRHLDRHGLERLEPRRAAERPAAGPVAAQHLRLVADADLPHLDPRAEVRREVAHQLTEIDSSLGRVIEDEARPVEELRHAGELHAMPALADLQQPDPMGFLLPLRLFQ